MVGPIVLFPLYYGITDITLLWFTDWKLYRALIFKPNLLSCNDHQFHSLPSYGQWYFLPFYLSGDLPQGIRFELSETPYGSPVVRTWQYSNEIVFKLLFIFETPSTHCRWDIKISRGILFYLFFFEKINRLPLICLIYKKYVHLLTNICHFFFHSHILMKRWDSFLKGNLLSRKKEKGFLLSHIV